MNKSVASKWRWKCSSQLLKRKRLFITDLKRGEYVRPNGKRDSQSLQITVSMFSSTCLI